MTERNWLLIDCAHKGEVRLAHAKPSAKPIVGTVYTYVSSVPTFTDVLLRYAQDSGHSLFDLEPVIAIGGVPGLRSMAIERSRWVISRDGLAALFGMEPVILNEVAAQAWALRTSLDGVTPILGSQMPDLTKRGRYVFLTYEEGVGTAVMDVDGDGRCSVLEAEGGQLDFLPLSEEERTIGRLAAGPVGTATSWEQILMLRRDAKEGSLCRDDRLFVQLLGRFVSNLIYTSGAWNGAFMMGQLIPSQDVMKAKFLTSLTTRRPYARLLAGTSAWRVAQTNAVLKGCAAMMASRRDGQGALGG